ncbi:hypothetical protein R3P38DRAFT_148069 [Favolaschia claudopus]|uniref:Secreted protein n=1 Tax=Favolaschia claudopus TaxID=2862362 RepID=A0AAV9ZUX3_9AGAR
MWHLAMLTHLIGGVDASLKGARYIFGFHLPVLCALPAIRFELYMSAADSSTPSPRASQIDDEFMTARRKDLLQSWCLRSSRKRCTAGVEGN